MLDYRTFAPPPRLRGIVQFAWTLRAPGGDGRQRVLPDGSVELVWNLADRFRRFVPGEADSELQPRELLVGPTTRHMEIEAMGAVDLVGVRIAPGAAAAVIRGSLAELCDNAIDAGSVDGLAASPGLGERLAALRSAPERAAAVLGELERLARPERIDTRVAAVTAAMARNPAACSVIGWGKRVGLAPRALERRFRRQAGTTPKRLARVLRFQRVLAGRVGMPRLDDMLGCGYFDQSHFLRDFREFAGTSPSVFFRREGNALSAAFTQDK